MKRALLVVLAGLGLFGLGGCVAFSEQHPVTESRYVAPELQAYWLDRRWRQDKADYWAWELERQSAARMARNMGN